MAKVLQLVNVFLIAPAAVRYCPTIPDSSKRFLPTEFKVYV